MNAFFFFALSCFYFTSCSLTLHIKCSKWLQFSFGLTAKLSDWLYSAPTMKWSTCNWGTTMTMKASNSRQCTWLQAFTCHAESKVLAQSHSTRVIQVEFYSHAHYIRPDVKAAGVQMFALNYVWWNWVSTQLTVSRTTKLGIYASSSPSASDNKVWFMWWYGIHELDFFLQQLG